jgi:hypothetical protein
MTLEQLLLASVGLYQAFLVFLLMLIRLSCPWKKVTIFIRKKFKHHKSGRRPRISLGLVLECLI